MLLDACMCTHLGAGGRVEPFSPVRFGPVWLLPPCGVLSALACACALRLALGLLFLPCFGLLSCVVHTFTLCPDRFSCVLFSCVRLSLSFLSSAIASPCLACHLLLHAHIPALFSPTLGSKTKIGKTKSFGNICSPEAPLGLYSVSSYPGNSC